MGDKAATWDILSYFSASSNGQPGIETNGSHIYTALWNGSDFFRYNMDGSLDESFTVAGVSQIRDMAYDGIYFYGSNASMTIYVMDLENEILVSTISASCSGITGIRHIAYDPTLDGGNGGFWIGNWNELGAVTMTGAQLHANIGGNADCYGSAYDPFSDIANPRLLLFQQNGTGVDIHGFDINTLTFTGLVHSASDIPGFNSGISIAGGLCLYGDYVSGNVELIGNIQDDPNIIFSYYLTNLCDSAAPGMPQNLQVLPDATGALSAQLTWDNPAYTVGGSILTDLDSVMVYADMVVVYKNTSPVIGAGESQTIAVASPGNYIFNVAGFNDHGNGLPSTIATWVGEDVPAAPQNLEFTINDTIATIDWDAPEEGMHGGYFSGNNVTYAVILNNTDTLADNITNTAFSTGLAQRGKYYVTVVASNLIGPGGNTISDTLLYGYLFYEDFPTTEIPSGWEVQGAGLSNWSVQSSGNAGGAPNELTLSWSPSFVDTSTIITPSFNTTGQDAIMLVFDTYQNNYSNTDYYLSVVTSSDGVNWNEVWSLPPVSYGPSKEVITIDNSNVGSETFYLGFRLTGNSYNLNYWYIDNIMVIGDLEPVDMTFHVTDTSANPLRNASISLGYNGNITTANDGYATKTTYKDFMYSSTYNWEAGKFGYFPTSGSFIVDEPDTIEVALVPMDIYNLTFIVSDTSGALLPGIGVNLEYYESMVTDENGVARYDTVYDSQGEALDWSVWTLGYSHASGSVIIDANDTIYVELTPLTPYPVTFEVYDTTGGEITYVKDVTISLDLYGNKLTDELGMAVYDSVYDTEGEAIEWSASKYGYYSETGSVVVSDTTLISIILTPLPVYHVTFAVTDTNGIAITGATVNLDVYGELVTDASGMAVYDTVYETSAPGIPYQVSAAHYFAAEGRLILVSDTVIEIQLVHYPYVEITFHVSDGTADVAGVTVNLNGYGNEITNASGEAVFESVMCSNGASIAYTVTGDDINTATGNVIIDVAKTVEVLVTYKVGLPDITEGTLLIYPNPARDVVTIVSNQEIKSVEILSSQGRLIESLTGNGEVNQISLSGLIKGNYFLIIRTDNTTFTRPLVVVE